MSVRVTVTLARAPEEETPLQVCWHNLLFADRVLSLELFAASAYGWLKTTGSDYQQLERELRERHCHTHLIAATHNDATMRYSLSTKPGQVCRYYCIISCRERSQAQAELRLYATSYEENFARLTETGDIETEGPPLGLRPPEGDNIFTVLGAARHKLALAIG